MRQDCRQVSFFAHELDSEYPRTMIESERCIAVIPARGGSKSVPLKNLHPLGGRPLLEWPIRVAQATPEIDRIIVSTDHDQIAETARAAGAEVSLRPEHLSGDTALPADMLRHLIASLREEGETARYLVLLEPTAPFRLPQDVSACLKLLHENRLDSVATFMEAHLNPHRAWTIQDGKAQPFIPGSVPWRPRQSLPPAHQLNGAVYAFVADELKPETPAVLFGKSGAIIMDKKRSFDIDDAQDFAIANALLAAGAVPLGEFA